jgi:tetrahydromethanopterin S-methyltransferase subunit D
MVIKQNVYLYKESRGGALPTICFPLSFVGLLSVLGGIDQDAVVQSQLRMAGLIHGACPFLDTHESTKGPAI